MSNYVSFDKDPATGQRHGLADAVLRCNSIPELRALTPLPLHAQELIDAAVVNVGLNRLAVVRELMAAGLVYNLPDPLSVTELYWEAISKTGHATRTMVPDSRGERQHADRSGSRIPIYITMDDFSFNIRELRTAERAGAPLDTTHVEQATRRVNEAIEDAALNGAAITVNGNSVPGILTEANINTQTYVDNETWTAAAHSGQDILDDVLNMADTLRADNYFGPYTLFVGTAYGNELNKNFGDGVTTFDTTIRGRLMELVFGSGNLRVVEADQLPATNTILMQMTSNVADVVIGQTPTLVSWSDGPGWNRFWAVMSVVVPRIKSDYDSGSGICVGDLT